MSIPRSRSGSRGTGDLDPDHPDRRSRSPGGQALRPGRPS
ncbi:hypothetical protein Ae168Ps1_4597c [Pseudonocardia sp. Ae168_Ps1]|nr:hypothetical protein Ae150APs1_4569c [Pseudonocardia sp. Ae150A_Ps1]OLL82191.1 hypothetical protein Ae168Ps1_4597c [Pseudonocardia sp. Ae168_Ps1]OLL83694.1 hypothetical protein Ae263Ps1_0749 [Pseudonocardia sp. Ae263_Ps1]OLL90265.1 hypothetical protein Ae356Ps1_0162c [Pseudonocardia sp. Ae356_Ps1]